MVRYDTSVSSVGCWLASKQSRKKLTFFFLRSFQTDLMKLHSTGVLEQKLKEIGVL